MAFLAGLRYGDVFVEQGGPIDRLDTGELSVLGHRHCLVNAHLRDELAVGRPSHGVYGQADGTGIAEGLPQASHLAIAEALQRWAYLAVHDSPSGVHYGFDEDRSSAGMAASPGFFRRHAQLQARAEAIARHTIVSWWDGRLPAERTPGPAAGVEAIRIHHSAGPGEVVVVFRRTRAGYAYGHGYGDDLPQAIHKAVIGLARAEHVLTAYRAQGALATPANFFERRALFFAGEAGAELFGRRLLTRQTRPEQPFRPRFDGEIPGPWARWATVWRCCVEMPTGDYLEPDAEFFYW